MNALPQMRPEVRVPPDGRLARFVEGAERDPADSFDLADMSWPLGAYLAPSALRRPPRISFHGLGPITAYVKWFVLERLLLAGRSGGAAVSLVTAARRFARVMEKQRVLSFEGLVARDAFRTVWDGVIDQSKAPTDRAEGHVWRQTVLSPFFSATRTEFGIPLVAPRRAGFIRASIAIQALRREKATPPAVVSGVANRLALHRNGREELLPFDLLRLCVLTIHLALGRRISELLATPRGEGIDGPFVRYTAADGQPARGFRFAPNKGDALDDVVYVSPAWEDVVGYAVGQVLALSDPVRERAEPLARGLFILVSPASGTIKRTFVVQASRRDGSATASARAGATALRYASFVAWLNGRQNTGLGALERWRITASGNPGDPPYRLLTHGARHARASALAADPRISRLAAARDLNHTTDNVVSIYQHGLEQQNALLREKAGRSELIGLGAAWAREAVGGRLPGSPRLADTDDRFRTLLAAQPELLEFNRVPGGYCTRPQGPGACPEFLECAETTDEGCSWFATDPTDGQQLIELDDRAWRRRQDVTKAAAAGRDALAGKLAVLAERAERACNEAVEVGSTDAVARLRAHLAASTTERAP